MPKPILISRDHSETDLFDLAEVHVPRKLPSVRKQAALTSGKTRPRAAPKPALPIPANALQASLRRRPVRVLQGIADPVRYKVLQLLAEGSIMSVKDLAKNLNAHPDTMGKHVKVLRTRGIVVSVKPEKSDGRMQLVQIPAEFRVVEASGKPVLDFGVCVVRFD